MMTIPPESFPVGFRFHPTDEELVNFYLKRKISGRIKTEEEIIAEVDVCKFEPWDLPPKSIIRSDDRDWVFFAPKDRKYANGNRSNRATEAGYWKATGKDRSIKTASARHNVIGRKKTLVFHLGRAPKGIRTRWIMHEYRTTEPEFESGDQGGYVLYRLFKKTEEKGSNSKADEMEGSGFSPTPTRSSPDGTPHEGDVMEENSGLLSQKSPESDSREEPQSLPDSVEQQPTVIMRWLTDKFDRLATYPVKPDESSCNVASDNHVAKAGMHDVSSQYHDSHHQQIDSNGFPNKSFPVLSNTDCPIFDKNNQESPLESVDDADRDSFHKFLDGILSNPDEYSTAESDVQKNSVAEIAAAISIDTEAVIFRDSGTSSDINTEEELPQEPASLEASVLPEELSVLLNDPSQINSSYGYPEIQPHLSALYENASLLPYDSTGPDVCSVDSEESLQDLLNSLQESSNERNIADNVDGLEVTGIKFRDRQLQHPSDSENISAQQSTTTRRIHLQGSVRNVSFACARSKSRSGGDDQDKEAIKKALQDLFDSTEGSLTQKDTPSNEDGFEGTGVKIRIREAQHPPSLKKLPSKKGRGFGRIRLQASREVGSLSNIAAEAGEHVDDNLAEFREISKPALPDKLEQLSIHDDTTHSSELYQEPKSMLRLRTKGTYDNANVPKDPPPHPRISRTGSVVYVVRLALSVILLLMCFGIWRCRNS